VGSLQSIEEVGNHEVDSLGISTFKKPENNGMLVLSLVGGAVIYTTIEHVGVSQI
jgi:hypothetical protein